MLYGVKIRFSVFELMVNNFLPNPWGLGLAWEPSGKFLGTSWKLQMESKLHRHMQNVSDLVKCIAYQGHSFFAGQGPEVEAKIQKP